MRSGPDLKLKCRSIVNSGKYDWVLAEITQDEQWVVPLAMNQVKGWKIISERDSGFSFQHTEDRASMIFWRCMMAVYFGDFSYAAPILDSQSKAVPGKWNLSSGRSWIAPAVGVVEVVKWKPYSGEETFEIIH